MNSKSIFSNVASVLTLSLAACLTLAMAAPSVADAQKAEKPKVKTFDFSGDDIDGEAAHNLIRIRKDFIKEIVKSAEDL